MDSLTASPVPVSTPILIAFGLEALRRSVQMGLKDAGYAVVETAATASTIAYLHFAQVPHTVLLDFWLPPGTAEPLLHVVGLDAALQRHRYVLALRPDRLPPTFSAEAERLIHAVCTNVLENPLDTDQLLAAIAQSSGITASQRGESLPLRREHHHRHNPGALSAALTQVARRLHLSGRG
jgi:DNA-binding NtrC family response regulator